MSGFADPFARPARPRPLVVQKYGGSSVADLDKIGKVADRVARAKREGYDVVVVVSAMGKTTDELLALARRAGAHDGKEGDPPRRELDMLLTTGERVTMSLVSIALQSRGCEAISFTGSQSGILTNDRHFDARIIEVRPHRIEDELERGRIVIVAGYQGMSYRREITTLGRGGSDTTAVALAAALGAERCEIYSDVDGVYSADPRVVPDAKHIPELDHATLEEMAECGAKVICAQAIEWARKAGIAIHARATFGSGERETIATESGSARARAVVGEKRVVFAHARSGEGVLDALGAIDLPFRDLSIGPLGASFCVPLLNVPDWADRAARLSAALPALVLSEPEAMVSLVGNGLASAAVAHAVAAAIGTHGGLVATPLRVSARVKEAEADDAQRALHAAFVS